MNCIFYTLMLGKFLVYILSSRASISPTNLATNISARTSLAAAA
jgi:hypothetical protein